MDGSTNAIKHKQPSDGVMFMAENNTYTNGEQIVFSGHTGVPAYGVSLSSNGKSITFAQGYKYLVSVYFTPTSRDGGIQGVGAIQGYANATVWKTSGFTAIVDARSQAQSGSIQNNTDPSNTFVWFAITVVNLGGGN